MTSKHSIPRGYALVVTLAIVALIFAFAIFLLTSAGWERKSAASFRSAISTRQLADTAVSVVQGQINTASTQGGQVSWTSQPGMIRTFDPKGKLLQAYKLYSATQMVTDSIDLTADLPPGTWTSSPAIWTDLNAPVEISGAKYYPILDPSALGSATAPEGLAINNAPGVTSSSYQQAPMPVKWLYLLRNGELAAATSNSSNQAVVSAATTDNPIVGRIAFWTDDETGKVNINTASEGTYWDTPRLMTKQEQDFANYQPAQREFQRYPGHPATTSLSAVFPSLTAQQIFSITPKIIGGGSNAGTQVATGPLEPDNDRLYADVGELIFDPKRNTNSGLSKSQVEQARFCLTAVSRAPEVNMYNLPRVASWPVYEGVDTDHTTAFDRLIAFCSSLGNQPYYFQRSQADSTTHDISITRNTDLYKYLQKLTSLDIPGYGGNFLAKYSDDRNQILTEIFDYIRSTNLYDDNLAIGNQFTKGRAATKMVGPAHGWVAPSVNSNGTLGLGRAFTLSEFGIGFICNAVADDPATPASDESSGSNIPTGAGANAVLGGTALQAGEKYIQAILIPEFFSAMQGYTVMWPQMSIRIKGLDTLSITRDGVKSSLFPAGMTEAVSINGTNPNSLTSNRNFGGYCDWRYALVSPAATTPTTPYGSPARGNLPADAGDTYPFIGIPIKITAPPTGGNMRFNGGDLTVEIYAVNSLTPTSTDLVQTIAIKLPAADFPIPSLVTGPLPAPSAGTADTSAKQSWWTFRKGGSVSGNVGRLSYAAQDPGQYQQLRTGQFLRKDGDVLRTVMPAHGDYRLVAGLQNVPDSVFVPHRYYSDTTKSLASNFIGGSGSHIFAGYDMDTKYLSNLYYGDSFAPDIPGNASLANRPESTGDYDTGLSNYMDGPFINKPDEGDSNRGSTGTGIPYFSENWTQILLGSTFFSPNRLIPSPGMFGSLPTGVKAGVPWRTLLFRPQTGHFGATSPKDSLLMDLFWMPVVEPYAISDRFSTAGKINMNYQILPFTYIERSTGLRALLKSEKVMAIPDKATDGQSNVFTYKKYSSTPPANNYRMEIDPAETLSQFTKVFTSGDVFRSASDICDLYMVPKGQSLSTIDTFWAKNRLTGDNLREKVYTTLYPRLTTKSNAYTVHMKVQALRKKAGSQATIWQEGVDEVLSEYRGATVVERFIDASNPDIPDYAADPAQIGTNSLKTLDTFYKWRTISNRQFAP